MEREIERCYASARHAWPAVELSFAAFRARALAAAASAEALRRLHTDDLYLAWACSERSEAGLAAFEAAFAPVIGHAIAKLGSGLDGQELQQRLRVQLFVGHGERGPKIAQYGGTGPLRAWVRVVAARTGLNMLTREAPPEVPAADELSAERIGDAELDFLKAEYRAEFREAFATAVASLSPSDRALLRQSLLRGLTARQLAEIHGTHHTTIVRRLARARALVIESTRAELAARLRASAAEVQSVMDLIASRVDVSLARLLGPDDS